MSGFQKTLLLTYFFIFPRGFGACSRFVAPQLQASWQSCLILPLVSGCNERICYIGCTPRGSCNSTRLLEGFLEGSLTVRASQKGSWKARPVRVFSQDKVLRSFRRVRPPSRAPYCSEHAHAGPGHPKCDAVGVSVTYPNRGLGFATLPALSKPKLSALLRSFALSCGLAFALFCAHLCVSASDRI